MTPEQHLGRIIRTYSPPWVIKSRRGKFVAALPRAGTLRLIFARNLDDLARQLRQADLQRPATRVLDGRALWGREDGQEPSSRRPHHQRRRPGSGDRAPARARRAPSRHRADRQGIMDGPGRPGGKRVLRGTAEDDADRLNLFIRRSHAQAAWAGAGRMKRLTDHRPGPAAGRPAPRAPGAHGPPRGSHPPRDIRLYSDMTGMA
jgi:hypothetical protein